MSGSGVSADPQVATAEPVGLGEGAADLLWCKHGPGSRSSGTDAAGGATSVTTSLCNLIRDGPCAEPVPRAEEVVAFLERP